MCGIFGYIGPKQNAGDIILDGLKALEYRGYDSWGIAVKENTGRLFIEKHTGKIGDATLPRLTTSIGIGHTRWATHGGVTVPNAHPHTDCKGQIIVVHNGIVENFEEIKKELLKKGHTFKSETDSEVIAHLLEDEIKTESEQARAVQNVWAKLKGMNAIITFFPNDNNIFVIKNGSPIVVARGKNEYFIASDSSALISHTKDVYFVKDDELLELTSEGITRNEGDTTRSISYQTLQFDVAAVLKGTYPHFMLKEIHEQPKIIRHIMDSQLEVVKNCAALIKKAYGTYLIGCGTASYACLAGTYLFSKIAKRHINSAVSSEFTYSLDFLKDTSLVIALSQSGETIDTISAVQKAQEKKASIIALTNAMESTLYRLADFNMLLYAGPEKAVASTKAYTAKIAFLYLIAHELAGTLDVGIKKLSQAVEEIEKLLERKHTIKKLASHIQNENHIFILGRGVSYAAALESALKIKEVSYIHAEGFAAAELKHGVIALIQDRTPVIIFNPEDETYADVLSSAHEVKARGAYVVGISSKEDKMYDDYIEVKNCEDATIIPNVVIAQLLGYYLSVAKGYDPDKPRNLAKSVTVK